MLCRLYNQPYYLPPYYPREHLPAYQPAHQTSIPSYPAPASPLTYTPTTPRLTEHLPAYPTYTASAPLPTQRPLPASTQWPPPDLR